MWHFYAICSLNKSIITDHVHSAREGGVFKAILFKGRERRGYVLSDVVKRAVSVSVSYMYLLINYMRRTQNSELSEDFFPVYINLIGKLFAHETDLVSKQFTSKISLVSKLVTVCT